MNDNHIADNAVDPLHRRLTEACDALWDALVDPREAYLDDDGLPWDRVAIHDAGVRYVGEGGAWPLFDERTLAEVRRECRRLAATNEFAINGLENRVNYLVGPGHRYRAAVRKGAHAAPELVAEVQEVIDDFQEANRWHARQQEIVRRLDRDGEAILRFFVGAGGTTQVRFVEPEQIAAPQHSSSPLPSMGRGRGRGDGGGETFAASHAPDSFGVLTVPHDVETVLGYYIDGRLVDESEIQFRRANVDANVKRGLPLYFPVRKNLRRVERLLRNMSALAEIQSAIALIRKHRSALRSGGEPFGLPQNCASPSGATTERTRRLAAYQPGTILDAPAGLEYDFPAAGINATNFVAVLQAELRAIAARLVMPEFMFTSDASNSNYASTLVAEGPAVKMFERLQATLRNDDAAVMWRVVQNAVAAGRLPADVRRQVEIQIALPSLHVRDQLKECQIDRIAYEKGILSPQTWSQRMGLDYEQEQQNIEMHAKP